MRRDIMNLLRLQEYLALGYRKFPRKAVEECGLARTIGSDDRMQGEFFQRKIYSVYCLYRSEVLLKVDGPKDLFFPFAIHVSAPSHLQGIMPP